MRVEEMEVVLNQLCNESRLLMNDENIALTRSIMRHITSIDNTEHIECDRTQYIWTFMLIAAVSIQIRETLANKSPSNIERTIRNISNNLRKMN